ncbi:hypothetical protein [Winogradskya consettensis]|uniref:hypothetical protein n=1 Tax=Winogradskya consettensis TaxID=113560 RepID=UPI001BB323BF|nr:hypothetical protein [Actinoplanes consettensis]
MPTTVKRLAIGLTSLTAIVAGFGMAATPPRSVAATPVESRLSTSVTGEATTLTIRLEPAAPTARDC